MKEDSLYQSLCFVTEMQKQIENYKYEFDNIYLNLTCDSFQCAREHSINHMGFRHAQSFFSFIHEKYPDVLNEWRENMSKKEC